MATSRMVAICVVAATLAQYVQTAPRPELCRDIPRRRRALRPDCPPDEPRPVPVPRPKPPSTSRPVPVPRPPPKLLPREPCPDIPRRRRAVRPDCIPVGPPRPPPVIYHNSWDNYFWNECPSGYSYYRMRSYHDNSKEDRRFRFDCRPVGEFYEDDCTYSSWANKLDGPLNYRCPNSGVVVGVQSFHSNYHEDREFKFKCCKVRNICLSSCVTSAYLNGFDQRVDYTAPSNRVIVGLTSYHDNGPEDRRWRVITCVYRKC